MPEMHERKPSFSLKGSEEFHELVKRLCAHHRLKISEVLDRFALPCLQREWKAILRQEAKQLVKTGKGN